MVGFATRSKGEMYGQRHSIRRRVAEQQADVLLLHSLPLPARSLVLASDPV